jgi:hypothetical protein
MASNATSNAHEMHSLINKTEKHTRNEKWRAVGGKKIEKHTGNGGDKKQKSTREMRGRKPQKSAREMRGRVERTKNRTP